MKIELRHIETFIYITPTSLSIVPNKKKELIQLSLIKCALQELEGR